VGGEDVNGLWLLVTSTAFSRLVLRGVQAPRARLLATRWRPWELVEPDHEGCESNDGWRPAALAWQCWRRLLRRRRRRPKLGASDEDYIIIIIAVLRCDSAGEIIPLSEKGRESVDTTWYYPWLSRRVSRAEIMNQSLVNMYNQW